MCIRDSLWLMRTADRAITVTNPPAPGPWRVGCDGSVAPSSTARPVGGTWPVGGEVAVLAPLVPPGLEVRPGDRLALGNLYADPALVDAIGVEAIPGLVDAFLA